MTQAETALLARFKADLVALYGARLEKVVLFGSRARGDAREDSDWDIAVFLRSMSRWIDEVKPLSRLRVRYLEGNGAFFEAKPFPAAAWDEPTPFMANVRSDGIEL